MPSRSIGGPFGYFFFLGLGVVVGVAEGDAALTDGLGDGDGEFAASGLDPALLQPATLSSTPARATANVVRRLSVGFMWVIASLRAAAEVPVSPDSWR
jgi:hypothetical protein